MPLYYIFILSLVQGLTEFLPVSSSGHLVLSHYLMGESNNDLCWESNKLIDVAVHVGTLFSVLIYFRKDLIGMGQNITNKSSNDFKLLNHIILASLPVLIIGYVIHHYQFSILCMIEVMAWMTLIFGFILLWADKFPINKTLKDMSCNNALFIGISQAIALIPGVSRSGITMTTARFLGFSRVEAARFSLLLSIIAISGAGALGGFQLFEQGNINLGFDVLMAIALSFISGWIAIHFMMKWLSKATFKPFAYYRIILGIGLLIITYSNAL